MTYAADGGETDGSTPDAPPLVYDSQDINPFGPPSGMISLGMYTGTSQGQALTDPTAPTLEQTKFYQGCGGVTQADYTSGLYYMSGVFDKFKQDVNSPLAKQLLVFNYSMPQTAALFDTLNNYGNARYQQFQQACNLSALQKDARTQSINKCMTPDFIKSRTAAIQAEMAKNPPANGVPQSTPEQLEQLGYAQAYEFCSMQYSSDTTVLKTIRDSNDAFAKTVVASQNVKKAITPFLCVQQDGSVLTNGCWQLTLLPEIRLCADAQLAATDGSGCTNNNKYGVREAPVQLSMYFDLMRYIASQGMVKQVLMPFLQKVKDGHIDHATQRLAAQDAVYKLGHDTQNPVAPDPSVKPFQGAYLACMSSDVTKQLSLWGEAMKSRLSTSGGANINLTTVPFATAEYHKFVQKLGATNNSADMQSLDKVVEAAAGCAVFKHVPMFDPNLVAALNTECKTDDLNAFYTMASYDVALQGTRDTYQYLLLRLKEVYGRLLTESMVPKGNTGDATTTTSPEINRKLADAVKEIMIPSIEDQLARLEKVNANRGQFAQRVQSIYAEKRGCINMIGAGRIGEQGRPFSSASE